MRVTILFYLLFITTAVSAQVNMGSSDASGNDLPFGNQSAYPATANKTASLPNFTVVHRIASPSGGLLDLAWDGQALWLASVSPICIMRIDPANGALLKSIPVNSLYPAGLEFDGTHLWLADNDNKTIQLIDTSNGAVLFTAPTPALSIVGSSYNDGLTIEDNHIWINDPTSSGPGGTDLVTKNDTLINTLASYYPPAADYISGFGFDGTYLWSSENIGDSISMIDPNTYTVLQSYNSPSSGGYANGITWDGNYLWISDNGVDSIYQVTTTGLGVSSPGEKNLAFTIFPNPVSDKAVLLYSYKKQLTNASFELINASGSVCKNIPLTGFSTVVSRTGLTNGIYFYSIKTGNEIMARGKILIVD